jgi:hypothetical protein
VQKWLIGLPCIRLWQYDAGEALSRRTPGLAALCPLMDYATPERVEEAVEIILQEASPPEQEELLAVLGIFAGGLLDPEQLTRRISRERIMASSFIQYVFKEEFAELQQQAAAAQQQAAAAQQQVVAAQQQAVSMLVDQSEEIAMLRFPDLQARYIRNIRQLSDVDALRELHRALVLAPDQPAAERILAALAER